MGVFDNFASLDGLIQVIYHSTSCFVLLSNVETSVWVVELGLVGGGNRWWRGSWSEKDVSKLMGSSLSEEELEIYSTKLANFIIAGELSVGDWNANKVGGIKLQLNPTHKVPVVIDLTEVPTEEGSARAITILKGIALQTQSRGCRINGVPQTPYVSALKPRTWQQEKAPAPKLDDEELRKAEARIKRLENEINLAKQVAVEKLDISASKPAAPKPRPGASRANPTRQKRKIVQAEFESD